MNLFHSEAQMILFLVVVGAGLVFVLYLFIDGLYHRLKWRRLSRKFGDANRD